MDSSSKVTVDRLFAYTGDDSLVVKATDNSDQLADPHDLTFQNSVLLTLKTAMKLGTESRSAQFYGISFARNTVVTGDRAFGFVARDGAAYHGITYDDNDIHDVAHMFSQDLSPRSGENVPGSLRDVTFRGLRVTNYHPTGNGTADNKTVYAFQLAPIAAARAGEPVPVSAAFTDQASSGQPIKNLRLSLQVPYGWDVRPVADTTADTVQPGQRVEATWQMTPPSTFIGAATLYAVARYVDPSGNRQLTVPSDGGVVAVKSDLVQNVVPDRLGDTRATQQGATFLADRDYTISGLPGALTGGVLIPGANADKSATSPADYLTFDVTRDATVYACFDARGENDWWPAWLTDGFQRTDMTITTSDKPYVVFAKQVSAGQVVLGPNAGRSGVSGNNSYFTIVMPR